MHWALPVEAVRALVPRELELDPWDGKAWVGLVPFQMRRIRTSWMPGVLAMDFLELNARTYVHKDGVPGVWFFSLEASAWLAVQAARAMWSLPYHHARMSDSRVGERVTYRSERRADPRARFEAEYEIGELLGPSAPDTFEHFLLERYVLFAKRGERILEGRVHHVPYPAHRATVHRLEEGLIGAAGLPSPGRPPDVAHYSPGVDVEVFGPM